MIYQEMRSGQTKETFNPIPEIFTNNKWYDVPCPASYEIEEEDLSDENAGRTEDGIMHKNRIGTIVGIKLTWQNVKTETLNRIMRLFNAEYFQVKYFDPKLIGYVSNKTFYAGNRTTSCYSSALNRWSKVSVDLIEVSPTNSTAVPAQQYLDDWDFNG